MSQLKVVIHVLNADKSCEVYHIRQTSSIARVSYVNTLWWLGNAAVAVKVTEAYLGIGGNSGASTAPYSVDTGCEVAGALN